MILFLLKKCYRFQKGIIMKKKTVKKQVVKLSNEELAKVIGGNRKVNMRINAGKSIRDVFSGWLHKWK